MNGNLSLWSRQIDAIVRLELKKYVFSKQWLAVFLLALAPVVLFLIRLTIEASPKARNPMSAAMTTTLYAGFFQLFVLRFAIFFGSMRIFTHLVRGEVLEKTLHYYLLVPVRREVLAMGKYVAGLVTTMALFGFSIAATYVLLFLPLGETAFREFMFEGNGMNHLAKYLAVGMLACVGYGAAFLLIGLLFRNPVPPAIVFLGWESFNFVLPPALQKISVVHYLASICPVPITRGPLAVIMEPASPWISVPGLLLVSASILAIAGHRLRRMEVTYSSD